MSEAVPAGSSTELRRAVGPWGSYTWGYADVGADIYVALGLVIATAAGSANIAFLFAGMIYATIGLAYTELAAMYPLAGGGQFWVMRGLGDVFGFTAGWSVLLAFTVDIALFAYISVSYLDRFFPQWNHAPYIIYEGIAMVILLLILNTIGVRESSRLNELVGAIDVTAESILIFMGFFFAFNPEFYWHQVGFFWAHFDIHRLMFGTSLAIISFVGLESISQAAQETERPTTVIPRTSLALILTILAYAIGLSNLALGVVPWQSYDPSSTTVACHGLSQSACAAEHLQHENAPMLWLTQHLPYIGAYMVPVIAVLGTILLMISSNSGVYGSSRIVYSMAHNDLLPRFFTYVHPKYKTPIVALFVFAGIAILEFVAAGLTSNALETLAQMYAFSAAVNYLLVFIALLRLRFTDTDTPRTFRMPWNVAVRRPERTYEIPITGVLGVLFLVSVLIMVIITNAIGRIAGPAWVVAGFLVYSGYRRYRRLPLLQSLPRDYSQMQMEVYEESGETSLAEEYREALKRQAKRARMNPPPETERPPRRDG